MTSEKKKHKTIPIVPQTSYGCIKPHLLSLSLSLSLISLIWHRHPSPLLEVCWAPSEDEPRPKGKPLNAQSSMRPRALVSSNPGEASATEL